MLWSLRAQWCALPQASHAHQRRWQVDEERRHLLALQRPVEELLAMGIHPVDLEDVLGQINPDGRRLHGGLLLVNEG